MASKNYRLTKTAQSYFQKEIIIAKSMLFIAAIVLFFLFNMVTLTNAAPTDDKTVIDITYPLDNSIVLINETVTGTSQNVPAGQKLWILVYPHSAYKYYPQHGSVAIENNGNWSIDIGIGTKDNFGEKFDIIAVLANQSAQNEFINYINTGINTNNWLGMAFIPNGAVEYAKVIVTRTNAPEVIINSPLKTVKLYDNIITGTAKYIPEGESPWIIIRPHTTLMYHPQVKPTFLDNENWQLSAQFGIKNDTNVQFDIITVLANQSAQNNFTTYLNTIYPPGQWPGMSELPEGSKELTKVTVTRLGILADFSANPTSGTAPLTVQFIDSSINATKWTWDFGDGGTSNERSPIYTYNSAGTYTVTLTISNANETYSKADTITVSSGSSSGGGGGGGSAGGSPEPQNNVEVKELSQAFISNGQTVKFEFPQKVTAVESITFKSMKTVGKTTTIVEMLKNQSKLVLEAPANEVYRYLNIWVGNGGYATPKNIENAVVTFKVARSWVQDKSIDPASITLNRYSDNKWEQLQTSKPEDDGAYLKFTAQTPGFSPFAITGKSTATGAIQPVAEATPTPTNNIVSDINLGPDTSLDPTTTQNKSQTSSENGTGNKALGFEMAYGIVSLLTVFYMKQSKKDN